MERSDMCFMGTSVVSGTAVAKVVAIGSNTVFGEMAREVSFLLFSCNNPSACQEKASKCLCKGNQAY